MQETSRLAPFMDIPLPLEAVIEGPRLTVRELMALAAGSVIPTVAPAGHNVEVRVGGSASGAGELAAAGGSLIVRVLALRGKS